MAADAAALAAPMRELKYVLRAYDKNGKFDETAPQPLWLVLRARRTNLKRSPSLQHAAAMTRELLAGYGESGLARQQHSARQRHRQGARQRHPGEHTVWVAGRQVPVDATATSSPRKSCPSGMHTVEVAVLDEDGNGELYLRDLEFERNDWFYVGIADLTVSESRTSGPADLLQGENAPYDYDSTFDGRLAFYVNGKFGEHWGLTASADTREGPVDRTCSATSSTSRPSRCSGASIPTTTIRPSATTASSRRSRRRSASSTSS